MKTRLLKVVANIYKQLLIALLVINYGQSVQTFQYEQNLIGHKISVCLSEDTERTFWSAIPLK